MGKFYNTIEETGQTLLNFEARAGKCEKLILEAFQAYNRPLIPFEVKAVLDSLGYKYELTSIRRSINTLTKQGLLKKGGVESQKIGPLGVKNYTWEMA